MATRKTIFSIEIVNDEYNVYYTGRIGPEWDNLTPAERKDALRQDGRIMNVLIAEPVLLNWMSGIVKAVHAFRKREAKKAAKKDRLTDNNETESNQ